MHDFIISIQLCFFFFVFFDPCPIFQSRLTDIENKVTLSDTFIMWNLIALLRMQRLVREELVVRPERKSDIYSFSGTKTRPNAAIPLGGLIIRPGCRPTDSMFVEKGEASCGYVTKHLTSSFQRHEGLHKHIRPCVCRFQTHCFTQRALKLHSFGTSPKQKGRTCKSYLLVLLTLWTLCTQWPDTITMCATIKTRGGKKWDLRSSLLCV